ncbi:hypothetical protein AV521_33265 [Streptomyces sp. IMTB 2501]|uniref:hypothetical protein n=1 Tax=Streptomyces sp. IMTB 2501 TaxID=1776340 RepID=UPI00096C649A|nr:hypothetical protein [Streptomyces sp. IMTB 2501]OLZ65132.1 hypothetical protein AV521_33265 [Streptomyces sp. IMTB 2501]
MSRLSFEKKRAQQPAAYPAVVPVRVFGAGGASVGGTSVVVAPGEEIQQAVLNHLQRLAISLGAPIRATIHDDGAGCVVPLEVFADGSSRMTGEPVRVASPEGAREGVLRGVSAVPSPAGARDVPPAGDSAPVPAGTVQAPTGQFGPAPVMPARQATAPTADVRDPEPAYAAPVPAPAPVPVSASVAPAFAPLPNSTPAPMAPAPLPNSTPAPMAPAPALYLEPEPMLSAPDPGPTHTPARGFDAVAEEVLGDGPVTETAEGAELLTEPMTRINEAVRAGRIEAAAELADHAVTEATTMLGPRHAEVLHLRELAAYIAYLGGEPVRAFQLSLDLARLRRQARDAESAYGNVRSAATAWRAVRDPEEGLRLGRDLIELWTDLATEPGPAADDPGPLESARARMVRLAGRAARAAQP